MTSIILVAFRGYTETLKALRIQKSLILQDVVAFVKFLVIFTLDISKFNALFYWMHQLWKFLGFLQCQMMLKKLIITDRITTSLLLDQALLQISQISKRLNWKAWWVTLDNQFQMDRANVQCINKWSVVSSWISHKIHLEGNMYQPLLARISSVGTFQRMRFHTNIDFEGGILVF